MSVRRKRGVLAVGVLGLAAIVVPVVGSGPASADYAPQPADVVGVGGDTPQFAVDNLINGDTVGHLGFDEATGVNRVAYFDASGDANGRQTYTNNVTTGVNSTLLDPTVVLRAGDNPVQRPQSSGRPWPRWKRTRERRTPLRSTINFVASASLPTSPDAM